MVLAPALGNRFFITSATWEAPLRGLLFLKNMSTHNNLYAKEAYLGVACSALLQLVSLNTLV